MVNIPVAIEATIDAWSRTIRAWKRFGPDAIQFWRDAMLGASIHDLPIKDEHFAAGTVKILNHPSSDSDIIEEAETHRFVRFGVMARGTNDCNCVFYMPIPNGSAGLNCPSA